MPQVNRNGWSRTRAVRVAFFVERGEESHPILDAIFKYCFSIWGGRFSLIIPCSSGIPDSDYDHWLQRFDPDIVYSYVALDIELQKAIHERCYPSELLGHPDHGQPEIERRFAPDIRLAPLSVSSLVPLEAARQRGGRQARLLLINEWWGEDCRFIRDSFGRVLDSVGGSLPHALDEYASVLTVIPAARKEKASHYFRENADTVESVIELLKLAGKDGRVRSSSQLSALESARPNLESHEWSRSFNIVAGDSFDDRLLYWNARQRFPTWRDGAVVDLRVPRACLVDADFLCALSSYLKKVNTVSWQGGGHYHATIRSTSLPISDLEAAKSVLSEANNWISFDTKMAGSASDCIPSKETLERAMVPRRAGGGSGGSLWKHMRFDEGDLRVDVHMPEHLRHAPSTLVSPYLGCWAQDISIGRGKPAAYSWTTESVWHLPRRLRMTDSFLRPYELPDSMVVASPRTTLEGGLAVYTNTDGQSLFLRVPTDSDSISHALRRGNDWLPVSDEAKAPRLVSDVRRSSAGRHFWGVHQLFGDLNSASSFLLHAFWRDRLIQLRAIESKSTSKEHTKKRVAKLMRGKTFEGNNEDHVETMAAIVERAANELKFGVKHLEWGELSSSFSAFRADYHTSSNRHAFHQDESDREHYDREEEESLARALQSLCARGVFHQGILHACRQCHHKSWVSIDSISSRISCEVCGNAVPAPVDRQWSFRLNQFLFESLRLNGVGPLFWALNRIKGFHPASFWFEGPLDVFLEDSADPKTNETDIDITAVVDGKVIMCEVKQSDRDLPRAADLASFYMKLRPDVGMLAVMEPISAKTQKTFDELSGRLQGTGIEPRLVTLSSDDFDHYPRLEIV